MTGAHGKGDGWGPPKSEEARKLRARMRSRYKMQQAGKVHVGDGKDVDHKKSLHSGGSEDAMSNLRVASRSKNRSVWGAGGKLKK